MRNLKYSVSVERSAAKAIEKITKSDRIKIISAIENLANNPRPIGSKKLTARDGWRIRVGNYRIIYEINDNELKILIVDVGHRKDIYR